MTMIKTTKPGRGTARLFIGWAGACLAVAALALPLAACSQEKPGPAEQAGKKIDETVDAAKASASQAAHDAKNLATDAAEKTKEAAEAVKEKVKEKM